MLTNTLITPVELATYKTRIKHHIYITVVAVLFRNGLIGLFLYGAIAVYIVKILFRIRTERDKLVPHKRFIYLKVLTLYQLSVLVMSLVVYWYIGNIIVAITLPLIEFLRRDMERTVQYANVERIS
jgi:fructose-specific phosphotransferase system IIC component